MKKKPVVQSKDECICGKDKSRAVMVECKQKNCTSRWWHASCAGLKGLKEDVARSLQYTCPLCTLSKSSIQANVDFEGPHDKCTAEVSAEGKSLCMDELKDSIVRELKQCIPTLLNNEIQKLKGTDTMSPKSALNVKTNDKTYNLIIKPNDADKPSYTPESWSTVVKKLPDQLLNLPVEKTKLTSKGLGYLEFPTKEALDKAAESLKQDFNIKVGEKNKKSVYPKIKVSGLIKGTFNKEKLEDLKKEIK